MNGSRTVLTMEQEGERIAGTIVDDTGYTYNIEANVEGASATGVLHDSNTGGSMELEAAMQDRKIDMRLYQLFLGLRASELAITYTLVGEDAPEPPVPSPDLDLRLVGTWRYTSTYVSGDFSVASDTSLIINADGTYALGGTRTAGGGSSGVFDSGSPGDYATGQWKTQNRQIFVNEGLGWQFYADYACDGANLMLTFANGNKQIWERIQ